jgi:hypothetical protein
LKRYLLPVAAAFAFALGLAGGALAGPRIGHAHSLVPSFAPHPGAWLHRPKRKPSHRHAPKRQPRPLLHLKATTLSIYEHSFEPRVLRAQGCAAARRHENGIVVLDFGKPAFKHGDYGTILFSGRFAPNYRITAAMLGYARGYVRCLPQGSTASIDLARGTSNYHPAVPSAYAAGVHWARETNKLGRRLGAEGAGSARHTGGRGRRRARLGSVLPQDA